jgi:hypothetical protein
LKLDAPAAPAPVAPISEPADDAGFGDLDQTEPSMDEPVDDKPFDEEPFDAGVEADEATDPKKFIEQLTGKLGQSLRKYSEEQGQPDFELEKFAVNSLLSATHTSEMDEEDKNDIIKKINTAGDDGQEGNMEDEMSNDEPSSEEPTDGEEPDFGGDGMEEKQIFEEDLFLDEPKKNNMFQPGSNDGLNENFNFVKSAIESASGDKVIQREEDEYGRPLYWSLANDNINYFIGNGNEIVRHNSVTGENKVLGSLKHYGGSPRPKDLPNETLYENKSLINPKKRSIFGKNNITSILRESFNQEDMENSETETPVIEPKVKPSETKPVQPSRRNKPFLPSPEVQPDPKAMDEATSDGVYFDTYSGAVQAASEYAKSKGYEIDQNSWDREISFGQGKPKAGQTARHTVELTKNGKEQRKALAIQVYNRGLDTGNTYEANYYIN